jgi:hypothetical protein
MSSHVVVETMPDATGPRRPIGVFPRRQVQP